jgi:hypothetical protein
MRPIIQRTAIRGANRPEKARTEYVRPTAKYGMAWYAISEAILITPPRRRSHRR